MKGLKAYRTPISMDGTRRYLRCVVRHRNIVASAEEVVRQTVLLFLKMELKVPVTLMLVEDRIEYSNGSYGRADVVLMGSNDKPILVIECKEPGILLGYNVMQQAIRYAQVRRVREVWLTNGVDNKYYRKTKPGYWESVQELEALSRVPRDGQTIPSPPVDGRGLQKFKLDRLKSRMLTQFAVSALHLILAKPGFYQLPWSHKGVHLLEDRGLSDLSIKTPVGRWNSTYRLFLVASEGRVITAGVGLNRWADGGLILCVAVLKENRTHHALQLNVSRYVEESDGTFQVYHDGIMGGRSIRKDLVINAVYESCRDDLIGKDGRLYLGAVPSVAGDVSWRNSRELMGNLLHYALIRTELREANKYVHI